MIKNRFSLGLTAAVIAAGMIIGCGCGDSGSGGTTGGTTGSASTTGSSASTDNGPKTAASNLIVDGGIPFGLVASENGDLKPWGEDSVKGATLAIKEFNDAGGANGKKVSLYIEDSNSLPEQGKSAAEALVSNDKVVCLLGEVSSGITAQIRDVAKTNNLPLIAIGATRTDLTAGYDGMARVCYTDKFQGPVMAKFAYDQLHLRNVAVMTDKSQPYSTGLSNSFKDYFTKLGGKIAGEEFYESKATQFQGQLTNLKALNPDGMFMSGYFNETGPIARQAADIGLKVPMLGGDGWDSSDILKSGGDAILGSYFCNHYNNKEDRPEVKDFLKKWADAYGGTPGTTMGALAYDAAALACDALKRANSTNPADLIKAIQNTVDFKGVSGTITLKGMHGDPPKRALVVKLTPEGQVFAKAYEEAADGTPK